MGQVGSSAGSSSTTTLGTVTTGVWNATTIALANGGTGATTAADALTNLGLGSAATARTTLGFGTAALLATGSGIGTIPVLGALGISGSNMCTGDSSGGIICQTAVPVGDALVANPLSQFASTTSAQLAGVISNETGSGSAVFGTSPTISSPVITNIAPAADFTLTQNSVVPFTSVNTGAVANTLYLTGGKVGIGTSTPATTLDIVGTTANMFRLSDNATNATQKLSYITQRHYTNAQSDISLLIGTSSTSASTLRFGGGSGSLSAATELQFFTAANNTTLTGTQRMTIDASGNVGIGTTSPETLLNLIGTGNLQIGKTTDSYYTLLGSNALSFNRAGSISYIDQVGVGGSIRFRTSNATAKDTSAVNILGNGNVGIGTTSPSQRLTVLGSGASTPTNSTWVTSGAPTMTLYNEGAIGNMDLLLAGASSTNIARPVLLGRKSGGTLAAPTALASGDQIFSFLGSGHDGSAFLNNASIDFVVNGAVSTSNLPIDLTFSTGVTSRSERMRITSSGNVGIGTAAPALPLHVLSTSGHMANFDSTYNTGGSGASVFIRNTASGGVSSGNKRVIYFGVNDSANTMYYPAFIQARAEAAAGVGNVPMAIDIGTGTSTSSSRLTIDSSGKVGIGTASPISTLQSVGAFTVGNAANAGAVGNVQLTTGGSSPISNRLTFGTDGTGWGFAISKNQAGTVSDLMTIFTNGNVGIGTPSAGYKLQVGAAADGSEARANAWNTLSDERLKKDFEIIPDSLEKLLSLNGYYYFWNRGFDHAKKIGVKAQEVEKVFPEVVSLGKDGFLSVSYNHLVAAVIEAIKEFYHKWIDDSSVIHREIAYVENKVTKLEIENVQMKAKVVKVESENAQLKARLEKIENLLEKNK